MPELRQVARRLRAAALSLACAGAVAAEEASWPVAETLQALVGWEEVAPYLDAGRGVPHELRIICLARDCRFVSVMVDGVEVRVYAGRPASASLNELMIDTVTPVPGGYEIAFRVPEEGVRGRAVLAGTGGAWSVTAGEVVEED